MRGDWIECKFDDVFFTTSGGTPSRRNENYYIGNIPWIKSGELKSNVITEAEEFISEEAVKNSSAKVFPAGTILLALYGATIGKIAILGIPAATNQAICGIFETPFVFSKYAYYYLVNKKSYLIKQGIGGAQPNISQTILKNLDFSLPPLPEQRAIVKKLESLFSSLDAGVADLKKAQQQLKIYRQAVLKKAFEGELILDTEVKLLKNITEKIGSGSTPKGGNENYKTSGIPLVRSLNIHFDYIKFDGLAFIDENQAEKLKNVEVYKDDVLLNITGASIGRVNIAPNEFQGGRVNQHVSIVRLNKEMAIPKFIKYFIQSPEIQGYINNANYGVTRQALTKTMIENMEVPLPTINLQNEIVKQIESRLSVCDSIERNIKESLEKAESLRQSILKKAIEGNLLTAQELAECKLADDYEPASVLLERIKAEQTEKKAKPSKKKPRHSVAKS